MIKDEVKKYTIAEDEEEIYARFVRSRRFFEDFLVFDVSDDGRIVAGRAPVSRMSWLGDSLWSHMSWTDRESVRSFLLSYESRPMIAKTDLGIALILPALMPGASAGVAVFPQMNPSALFQLLIRDKDSFLWSGELRNQEKGRMTKEMRRRAPELAETLREIRFCFGNLEPSEIQAGERIESALIQRARLLSRFVGCPVRITEYEPLTNYGEFDFSMFSAFVLGVLCFCRRLIPLREAELLLCRHPDGVSVTIRMACHCPGAKRMPELIWLESLASRKYMLLEQSLSPSVLQLRMVPTRHDWSYLGLKEPNQMRRKEFENGGSREERKS